MKNKTIITPEQCKAGRDLLKWNQKNLSEISGVGINTIATFEKGKRELKIGTLEKILPNYESGGAWVCGADILVCRLPDIPVRWAWERRGVLVI